MNVYIYSADIYCENCGKEICKSVKIPEYGPPYDTGDYPYGPIPDGGGEADSPQHCGNISCGVFLENPLTEDGENYVKEIYAEGKTPTTHEWFEFYNYIDFEAV